MRKIEVNAGGEKLAGYFRLSEILGQIVHLGRFLARVLRNNKRCLAFVLGD